MEFLQTPDQFCLSVKTGGDRGGHFDFVTGGDFYRGERIIEIGNWLCEGFPLLQCSISIIGSGNTDFQNIVDQSAELISKQILACKDGCRGDAYLLRIKTVQ